LLSCFLTMATLSAPPSLHAMLADANFVDCTHAVKEGDLGWYTNPRIIDGKPTEEGLPDTTFKVICPFRNEKMGYRKDLWSISCDCGTHMDSPAHFNMKDGARTITDLTMKEFVCPAVVIDVSSKVIGKNEEYKLTVEDLLEWEKRNGPIPEDAFVCMKTGWSRYFRSAKYVNKDSKGTPRWPGFSQASAAFLYDKRNACGIGIDTMSLDIGSCVSSFPAHVESLIKRSKYQIENMDLSKVPEAGATFINLPLKIHGAPESLTRVLAIVPRKA